MKKLRKDDSVIVIHGKNKGKVSKILHVMGDRLLLDGVNMVKKHVKPNPNKNIEGGIVEREASIHTSNVAIYNTMTGKKDRVGFKIQEDGKKIRFYKSNNEVIG